MSEIRYRRLFEAAQDGILLINADSGQIEDANPYLIQMLGYSHDELLGKKLWEAGAFVDVAKCIEMFKRLRLEGYVRYDDLPLRTRAGKLIGVEFISNAYDCDGVRVIQCNVRNMTEQRLAEEQVRKLSRVVEQSPLAIIIANSAGEIEYVNAALVLNSGYPSNELLGQPTRMLHSGAASLTAHADLSAAVTQGSTWRGEFNSRRKNGSEFTASAVVAPIHLPDGSTSHYVAITEDVTQRKRDAQELERHRYELELLVDARTRELAAAKLAAEAGNIAKSSFLTNMSHEIRTPLGAITGLAYLIRRTQLTEQQTDWLTKLDVAGAHLLELINAVLDLSKIEAGKFALDVADVDMRSIAARVVSMLSERAAAKKLRLNVEMQCLPPGLVGDAVRLQQALLNYAVNAVKFTEEGSVTLRASCTEETAETAMLRIEVQDTGGGIDPAALPRLFFAFEQADNSSSRQHGGTGLGLAIVKQLARLMGGDAGAESVVGTGSTFWFTARLHKAAHGHVHRPRETGAAEVVLSRDHAEARLLLVDDDGVNREIALAMLQTVTSNVDVAEDGEAAIRLAGANAYDLIFMDMQMPGVSGLEATRRIRLLPGCAHTVIVALTANVFAEDKAACFAAGMDDFLAKPFTAEILFETLLKGLTEDRQIERSGLH